MAFATAPWWLPGNISQHYSSHVKSAMNTSSMIGAYGDWAASLVNDKPSPTSWLHDDWSSLSAWKQQAHNAVMDKLGMPDLKKAREVTVNAHYVYDGLEIEEISWQLPYGPATEAIVLKPQGVQSPLPGVLAFHDHGGNKYFGKRKITRTSDKQHELIVSHQQQYYEGQAWANELASRGYVVMVHDAFPFASRRVRLEDVSEHIRSGLTDENPERKHNIEAYNRWAGDHEHVMAKSLFCAGTTWPAVFLAEDQKALDVLGSRSDVDETRLGCAGLSGGGMRTVFAGGLDDRIKCAVCVGFMTTWRDFLLHKSFTHTWMTYVPLLPNALDFPEILGLRVPLPTLVQNDADDFLYTLPEMERADKILQEIYEKADASDRYRGSFYPGPHKFDRLMQAEAFAWFDRWL